MPPLLASFARSGIPRSPSLWDFVLAGEQKPRYGCRHMSDLRSQINSLSAAEKAELLDMLWESLEADSACCRVRNGRS